MNLPNKLTIARVILIPIFMIFAFPYPTNWSWFHGGDFMNHYGPYVALGLFVIASVTDLLDGKIARKYGLVTDFGKFLDPIADKLLVTAALLSLIRYSKFYLWATMIILAREFIVTGIRLIAASKNKVIAAGKLGKIKTVIQMIAIIELQCAFIVRDVWPEYKSWNWAYDIGQFMSLIGWALMALAVLFTIISGIEYVKKNLIYFTETM